MSLFNMYKWNCKHICKLRIHMYGEEKIMIDNKSLYLVHNIR